MGATEVLRETISKRLGRGAAEQPNALDIAASTVALWRRIADQLTPVIGARGVEALFSRALHLATPAFPWLEEPPRPGAAPIETLRAQLEGHEAAVSAEAGCSVLVTFIELLGTLIGPPLSQRLLEPVWDPPPVTSQQERAP